MSFDEPGYGEVVTLDKPSDPNSILMFYASSRGEFHYLSGSNEKGHWFHPRCPCGTYQNPVGSAADKTYYHSGLATDAEGTTRNV